MVKNTGLVRGKMSREVLIFKDIDKAADYAVRKWAEIAEKTVTEKGSFSVALSGGKTPATLLHKLAKKNKLPWNKTHVFMVDERFVPYHDENNNYRMINEILMRHVDIPAKNIHPILTTIETPQASALKYEKDLNSFFSSSPGFDLVLLGIGKTLFARQDGIEAMWAVVDPIIKRWEENPAQEFPNYTAGTWGPEKANDLIKKDGRQWRIW